MSEALNIIKAHFGSLREVTTAPVWQYDYGKKLEIDGISNLPSTFEIHYSNSKARGTAKRWIGYDGVVDVLDEYLRSGADVWCFIFLHEGEDDGQTEYVIHIPVKERSEAEDSEPTPMQRDIVDETIAALNAAVEQCEAYVEHYPTVINGEWYVWNEATEQFVTTGVAATGNGIASARLNSDYTLTLVFTDGSSFTTPISIRGATGNSGVYIGDSEPTDPNQNVWINPSGGDDMQEIVDAVLEQVPQTVVVTVTGTTPIISAEADHVYKCGELTTLSFTPCETGICDIIFTSGSTATVVTIPNTVKFPDGAFSAEANKTYEINVMDGVYGAVISWA